jgi:hypothetical protein
MAESNVKPDYKMERLRLEIQSEMLLKLEQIILCHRCQLVPRPGVVYLCSYERDHIVCSECYNFDSIPQGADAPQGVDAFDGM